MGKQSWYVAGVIVLLHVIAQWAGARYDSDAPLGVAAIATGVMGFLWLLSWSRWPDGETMTREAALRAAIAGGIVLQYLSLVATVAFFGRAPESLHPVTQTFVTSFTAVVTVVIAFYFGASAYIEGKKAQRGGGAGGDA